MAGKPPPCNRLLHYTARLPVTKQHRNEICASSFALPLRTLVQSVTQSTSLFLLLSLGPSFSLECIVLYLLSLRITAGFLVRWEDRIFFWFECGEAKRPTTKRCLSTRVALGLRLGLAQPFHHHHHHQQLELVSQPQRKHGFPFFFLALP